MIIGSGLIATSFARARLIRDDICIFAAGVSNSACTDEGEFERERLRLISALQQEGDTRAFVYFGTCSVVDPDSANSPYVKHKLAMERLVAAHPAHLILRLPQAVGKTPNPHTLMNFLYARIVRSESFQLWAHATRNIIDVTDVTSITKCLLADSAMRNVAINIANPVSHPMPAIVAAMEQVVGKRAVYDVIRRGSQYAIDTRAMRAILSRTPVTFGDCYLQRLLGKYYGP